MVKKTPKQIAAIKKAKKNDFSDTGNKNSNGNALWWICNSYEG